MYTMKQACELTNLSYDTLKYYCNQGIVFNVTRNKNNHRIFDDTHIAWLNNISCLRNCGMTITEMKEYVELCLDGQESIDTRKIILDHKKVELEKQLLQIQKSIKYIDEKQAFYDDVKAGKIEYFSYIKM